MAAKNTLVQARLDSGLKKEVETILHSLGLSTSEAINVFFRLIVAYNGLPFDVRIANGRSKIRNKKALLEYLQDQYDGIIATERLNDPSEKWHTIDEAKEQLGL